MKRNRSGYAALMMTISLVTLCSVGGLVTDLGWAYHQKRKAQTAAEASALAASSYARTNGLVCGLLGVLCQSTSTNCSSLTGATSLASGCQYAVRNGYSDGSGNVTVTVTSGSGTPPGSSGVNADYWVQTTITENIFPMFSAILGGHNRLNIQTVATAAAVAGPAGGSIYVLGSGAGTVTTDGTLNLASATDIWVNSSSSTAVQLQGHDNVSCSGGGKLNCVGGCQQTGHSTSVSPAVNTGCAAKADPFANMPAPSYSGCDYNWDQSYWWGTNTITPGVYCGDLNVTGTATVTMSPGVYVIKGNLNVSTSGTLTGTGVTIYKPSGSCSLTGGTVNLSAQTSRTYKGVTIFQDKSNTNTCTLTCGSSQKISGAVYAPTATVNHCGGSSAAAPNQTIVCNKIAFTGGTAINSGATTLFTAQPGGICR